MRSRDQQTTGNITIGIKTQSSSFQLIESEPMTRSFSVFSRPRIKANAKVSYSNIDYGPGSPDPSTQARKHYAHVDTPFQADKVKSLMLGSSDFGRTITLHL